MADTHHGPAQAPAPRAHLVHRTARRMRLKVPVRRGDGAFFAALEQRLAAIPKIESAILTPHTASVLLHFAEGEGDGIAAAIDALELLDLAAPGAEPAAAPGSSAAGAGAAADGTGIDRRQLALTVLLLLLLRRLLRGGWLAPALALMWLLYELQRAHTAPADSGSG